MSTFADRLRAAMDASNMSASELAEKTKISKATISRYLSGEFLPKQKYTYLLSKVLDVDVAYLIFGEKSTTANHVPVENSLMQKIKGGYRIPVLGKVVAGVPLEAVTDILDYEEIPEEMGRNGEYFALEIKGRSMEPVLREGDVVIVCQQPEVENGEVAIVLVNGDEATVKKVQESPAGLTLIGYNVAVYEPHTYTKEQCEQLPIRIIGKVVELRRKF